MLFVYITVPTLEEAECIASALVEEQLAAGVNIVPLVHSVYRWKGEVRKHKEAVLCAQTQDILFERLAQRVRELHSYEVPCILGVPISHGNGEFLAWIKAVTNVEEQ